MSLKMYDVYTPLSETETALTYEESLKKAEEVLAIFGEEYSKGGPCSLYGTLD